jgi:hypothetical protein
MIFFINIIFKNKQKSKAFVGESYSKKFEYLGFVLVDRLVLNILF